jgi:hypothetical protein
VDGTSIYAMRQRRSAQLGVVALFTRYYAHRLRTPSGFGRSFLWCQSILDLYLDLLLCFTGCLSSVLWILVEVTGASRISRGSKGLIVGGAVVAAVLGLCWLAMRIGRYDGSQPDPEVLAGAAESRRFSMLRWALRAPLLIFILTAWVTSAIRAGTFG